jgi:(2Fe-2S) ferredoxin
MRISNKSDFIAKALEAYISGGRYSSISHEEVRKIVAEILNGQTTITQTLLQPEIPHENSISEEDADLLSKLFK